jgi:hypothetical protein
MPHLFIRMQMQFPFFAHTPTHNHLITSPDYSFVLYPIHLYTFLTNNVLTIHALYVHIAYRHSYTILLLNHTHTRDAQQHQVHPTHNLPYPTLHEIITKSHVFQQKGTPH